MTGSVRCRAEVILLDEINRIPLKSQSAFLEALRSDDQSARPPSCRVQLRDRDDEPGQLGEGTFRFKRRPVRDHGEHRLPAARRRPSWALRLQERRLNELMSKERIINCARRSASTFMHRGSACISSAWSRRRSRSAPTPIVRALAVGAGRTRRRSRRLAARDHLLGPAREGWALLVRKRTEVCGGHPDLAVYVLGHRLWLGPHAASHGLTTDSVIADVIERVAVP
jgi:hypothetical protein